MTPRQLWPIFLLAALTAACGSKNRGVDASGQPEVQSSPGELTRRKVKDLLDSHKDFRKVTTIQLSNEGVEMGMRDGLWTGQALPELTPKGRELFKAVYRTFTAGQHAELLTPVRAEVIEVTGITDATSLTGAASNLKEVHFTWDYVGLPTSIKRYAGRGSLSKAYFRLYDDGWRVEGLDAAYSRERAHLSAGELAQEQADERARQEEARRLEAQKADLRSKANVATRVIGEYQLTEGSLNPLSKSGWADAGTPGKLKVTDVGIEWISAERRLELSFLDFEVRLHREQIGSVRPAVVFIAGFPYAEALATRGRFAARYPATLKVADRNDETNTLTIFDVVRIARDDWKAKYGLAF